MESSIGTSLLKLFGYRRKKYDTSRMSRSIFIVSLMRALSLPHPFSKPNSPSLPHISSLDTCIATWFISHLARFSCTFSRASQVLWYPWPLSAYANACTVFFPSYRWIHINCFSISLQRRWIAWDPSMRSCLLALFLGPFIRFLGWSQCLKYSYWSRIDLWVFRVWNCGTWWTKPHVMFEIWVKWGIFDECLFNGWMWYILTILLLCSDYPAKFKCNKCSACFLMAYSRNKFSKCVTWGENSNIEAKKSCGEENIHHQLWSPDTLQLRPVQLQGRFHLWYCHSTSEAVPSNVLSSGIQPAFVLPAHLKTSLCSRT